MDENSSKSGDNDGDESGPSKKMKTEDSQQPSTSSAGTSSSSADTKATPSCSCSTESAASTKQNEEPEAGAPEVPAPNPSSSGSSANQNQVNENRPARGGDDEDVNDPNAEARADIAYMRNLERSVERLRRNVRRLANRRDRARNGIPGGNLADDLESLSGEEEEPPANDENLDRNEANRIRDELANDIVELLAPSVFDLDSSNSIDEARIDDGTDGEDNRGFEYAVDSGSDTPTSSQSSSSPSSTSNSSESLHYSDASDFDVDYVNNGENDIDVDCLNCLKTSSVKCQWNILREISQRQHGVHFRKPPAATVGGQYSPSQFQKRAYGSVNLVKRLGLMHKLVHHTGCVNCLNFHPTGRILASGSDDLRINLWNWKTKKLIKSIRSGHKNNVFQTRFLVCDGYDENEIELISTGRDGQVRHTVVNPSGSVSTKVIFRGMHPIHKVAIPARNDHVFLMAGEDAKVRLCDMRQAKVQLVVDVGKRLFSISTHPYDSKFCVSGSDSVVRVYDMRRASKPLKKLVPGHSESDEITYTSVTCAVYNHDGSEILASYSDDDIFLFKPDEPMDVVKHCSRFQGHCNIQTIKGVNFFGPHSEYVMSGSDCGYVYIWEKSSQRIVNWLRSSPGSVVNCLEPHPEFPILATSGVDDDIKIWVPKGLQDDQTAPVFDPSDLRRYVGRNVNSRNPFRGGSVAMRTSSLSRFFPAMRSRHTLHNWPLDDVLDEDDYDLGGRSRLDCSPS
uniref:WD repeat-containing protein 55 homolog n=1 Tax=Anopheles dirus TaxID=7168 RepID=A0A182NK96_9DIPT